MFFATLLNIPQAAKQLGCSTKTVRLMITDGTLPTVRIGRRNRIDRDQLVRWLADGGAKQVVRLNS